MDRRRHRENVWMVNTRVVEADLSTLVYTPEDEEALIRFIEKSKVDVPTSSETDSEVSEESPALFSSVFTPAQIIAKVKDTGSHPFEEVRQPAVTSTRVVRAAANRGGGRRVVKLTGK